MGKHSLGSSDKNFLEQHYHTVGKVREEVD